MPLMTPFRLYFTGVTPFRGENLICRNTQFRVHFWGVWTRVGSTLFCEWPPPPPPGGGAATSCWLPITSGVPQGSVLGPCLFNLFINDLISQTISPCALFADDTLLYRPIFTPSDSSVLQNYIDSIHAWCTNNRMRINTSKSKVLRITWAKTPECLFIHIINKNSIQFNNNTLLEPVKEYKYLGIMFNNRLQWNTHVDYVVKKANRRLGFVLSVSKSLTPSSIFSLFKTIVLPILEYGQPAWHLHTQALSQKVESVQRRATRLILRQKRQEMSYHDRLLHLNWQTLETRRNCSLMIYVVKALYGFVKCDAVKRSISVNSRHLEVVKFNHLRARTNRLHLSAINSFPRYWEELPDSLRSGVVVNSLQSWIHMLKNYVLHTKYIHYCNQWLTACILTWFHGYFTLL